MQECGLDGDQLYSSIIPIPSLYLLTWVRFCLPLPVVNTVH